MVETLRQLAEEYRGHLDPGRREGPGPGPGGPPRDALLLAELDPAVCSRKKIAVWHAFYGEAKSRPTYYRTICGTPGIRRTALRGHPGDLVGGIDRGGRLRPTSTPSSTARGLDAMTDGLWLDLLFSRRRKFDREAGAPAPSSPFLATLFPNGTFHPSEQGAPHDLRIARARRPEWQAAGARLRRPRS